MSDDLYYAIRDRIVDQWNWYNERLYVAVNPRSGYTPEDVVRFRHQRDELDLVLRMMAAEKRLNTLARKAGGR